jgi:hypothetical protein
MKVNLSIVATYDLEDPDLFDELAREVEDRDIHIQYLINRFAEDIDYMVKYDEVRGNILVEYIEE